VPCRLVVTLENGERKVSNVDHPRGHVRNPASDKDIEKKFRGLSAGALPARRISRLLKLCWKLDELDDVSEVVSLLRVETAAARPVSDHT
jgi:2-methylcitrate dehydratase